MILSFAKQHKAESILLSITAALFIGVAGFALSYSGFRPFGIALLVSCLVLLLGYIGSKCIKKKCPNSRFSSFISSAKAPERAAKAISIILILLFIAHYEGGQDYLYQVDGLGGSSFLNQGQVFFSLLGVLLYNSCFVLSVVTFFLPSKLFKSFRERILWPWLLLCLALTPLSLCGLFGNLYAGDAAFDPYGFRMVLLGIEYGLLLALYGINGFSSPLGKLSKGFYKPVLLILAIAVLCLPNSYTFAVAFGSVNRYIMLPLDLNLTHRILVYLAFALPIAYYFLLRPFDIPHRRALLTFVAYMALIGYLGKLRYGIWTNLQTLPLHLCNTAMYIVPLTLTFKTTKVFYFTMFINVIGAFLALLMPNYSEELGTFAVRVGEFYLNHLYAFFMPVLIVICRIYPRPTIKYFAYSMIGFLAYFVLVFVVNTVGTAYGYDVDFFFINSDFVADKLGDWAKNIFDISASFKLNGKTFEVHPAYLIAFYLVYVGLSVLMWYVYELLFKGVDGLELLLDKAEASRISTNEWKAMQRSEKMETNKATVEIQHLRKRYPGNDYDTVKDFSLHLEGGHIYAFLGKNGAGKSTIIKSIVGMHDFDGGSISICGYDMKHQEIKAKSELGFVPDHYALYESLTGRQYVNYIADLYGVSQQDRDAILPDLLKRLSMDKAFDDQIGTYSHGMKQKITIISSLVHSPKVWILDEPMTGVDPISIFQIKETMRSVAEKGNIVFFSTHLIDVVSNLCDEVIMLRKGELVYQGKMEDIKREGIDLEELFVKLNGGEAGNA